MIFRIYCESTHTHFCVEYTLYSVNVWYTSSIIASGVMSHTTKSHKQPTSRSKPKLKPRVDKPPSVQGVVAEHTGHNVGHQLSEGNQDHVGADQSTSDLLGSRLGNIHGRRGGRESWIRGCMVMGRSLDTRVWSRGESWIQGCSSQG